MATLKDNQNTDIVIENENKNENENQNDIENDNIIDNVTNDKEDELKLAIFQRLAIRRIKKRDRI